MEVVNIYMKINDKTDLERLAKKLQESYDNHEKIRYILDTCGSGFSRGAMDRLKKVFDKFQVQADEKLHETCIIVDGELKRMAIKSYVKLFNSKGDVRVI
jgi:hypothetical protein